MAAHQTNDNEVVFHLDGEEFFDALGVALDQVAQAAVGTPNTYVRMAYWNAVHDMPLAHGMDGLDGVARPPITVGDLLETKLRAVAMAGHPVDVILFDPSRAERFGPGDGLHADHVQFSTFLNDWRTTGDGAGENEERIRVFLEQYRAWSPDGLAASNHQKITLCSINGQRTVFLGGFNLTRSYWDNADHDRNRNPWHDTGVSFRGPATNAVEQEWLRRWRKSERPVRPNNVTVQQTYPAGGGGGAPANGARGVTVTIATTNTEGRTERDIQRLLIQQIQNAAQYAYFENYGFSDPDVVAALVARLTPIPAPAQPPPAVLVNVADPSPPYDYLDYVSWAQLAFLTCVTVQVPNPAGGGNIVVPRAGAATWDVTSGAFLHEGWLQSTRIRWQLPQPLPAGVLGPAMPGPMQSTPVSSIVSFNGGLRFYTPKRATNANTFRPLYLHSKLAIFDDRVAMVGTANFTYRSMMYDGEMAAFIDSNVLVPQLRQRLFAHYNTDAAAIAPHDAANWDANAVANVALRGANGLTPGELYVVPLQMADYAKEPPDGAIGWLTNHKWW
ncbi:phospholipase D-like domain-containing protein [Corallococcus exiguus]|uniref:phospholipase D-like domain-containing protein n=1 Tax=Corallococcus exiguus TaxID=83462 RepID=UPI0015617CAB|nr:phospholipase D-like domain-containing protein [Corallococcus exiguus]NRD43915.1 hypothetical protein [Corallococcus exiguus]